MNVFYVRPSNNGYYGVAEALAAQPGGGRLRTSLYRSTQFPLTYPLPQRLDSDMQGWFGLQAYDLLILAGLDPEVLSPKETRDVVAYVEHGGGLLVMGGQTSGEQRIGTWEPLSPVLPVTMLHGPDTVVDAPPEPGAPHWITAGLPPMSGRVQSVHAVQVRPDSRLLLRAGGQPLLVCATRGRGRVVYLNSYPQAAATTEDLLFADRWYADLLRRCCRWLAQKGDEASFCELSVPPTVGAGGILEVAAKATVSAEARVVARLERDGVTLATDEQPLPASCVLAVPQNADLQAGLTAALELHVGGRLVDYRATTVKVLTPVSLSIGIADGAEAYAPGMPFTATLSLTGPAERVCSLRARVVDPRGAVVQAWDEVSGTGISWTVGDLASGDYVLLAEAVDVDGKVVGRAARSFAIVDPPDDEHFFPFVSEAFAATGALTANEADQLGMIDDVAAHGFNVVTLGPVDSPVPLTNAARIRRAGERYAQALGMRLNTHGNTVPSFSRTAPPEDCIRDPEAFDRSLQRRVAPLLEAGKRVPRLFMMEILDEPLIAPKMICRCGRCLAAYQVRFGYPMPDWDQTCAPGREGQRTDLLQFASDYWTDIFRRCYQFKQASGARFDVHHTFCQLSFGTFCSRYYWRDAFAWMPYCDRFDWDVYPYIYPLWRGHRQLRCPNIRYHFAGHRALARFYGKPMGHWLDLSDRNVPHGNPPVRASSELLYTAIGQDAKLVRTFYNITFGRNNGARRERWDDLGAELNKINRYSAVLTVAHKPHAKLAMIFPATDWALRHHTCASDLPPGIPVSDFPLKIDEAPVDDWFPYSGPLFNAYELLLRAFGEADLLPEQMGAMQAQLAHHRAVALWGAKYLSKACAGALAAFVGAGGLLLCDGVPELDERGQPLHELAGLFGAVFEPLCDDVACTRKSVGSGETLLFNRQVNAVYSDAVVAGDARLRGALEGAVRGFLVRRGVLPVARPTAGDFEVDVLAGTDCFFIVAVNHNEVDDQIVVELADPPAPLGYAIDLNTGLEVALESGGRFRLALGARRGTIIGCYPERPRSNALSLAAQQGRTFTWQVTVRNAAGAPAAGHHPVELVVRDPTGAVRPRYGGRRATTGGVYSRTSTLAANEPPGGWEIELRDPITRTVSRVAFQVPAG